MSMHGHSQLETVVSGDIRELISYRPHWIIRKGNTVFLFILISLLAAGSLINYPDIIKGSMKLAGINAPKLLIARTEGKLQQLLVANQQEVAAGQPLAFLESTGSHEQVLALQNWIKKVEAKIANDSLEILLNQRLPAYNRLGEIQADYQQFQNMFKETLQILTTGYYQQKKQVLFRDLQYLAIVQDNISNQKQLMEQDYELQKKEYNINEQLEKDKVVAKVEMYHEKSKLIGKEKDLEQVSVQLMNERMAENNKKKEIMDLLKYILDQRQKFQSELFSLKSKVDAWVQRYINIAPENGKVIFVTFLQQNQLLSEGQELFYIQPPQSGYYGQLLVSQTGLGKIKTGQDVLVRVESYPSSEFGYLKGKVSYISDVPTVKDSFLIKVDLPNELMTNYRKKILFRNNLSANAEVNTGNRMLIERIAGRFKDLLKR